MPLARGSYVLIKKYKQIYAGFCAVNVTLCVCVVLAALPVRFVAATVELGAPDVTGLPWS